MVRSALAARHERQKYPNSDVADVSAALVLFPGATVGMLSATCVLAHNGAVHLQLMADGLLMTITQTSVGYDYGTEKREIRLGSEPVLLEDRAFIQAITSNDRLLFYSSYEDALKTHRLTQNILEASVG